MWLFRLTLWMSFVCAIRIGVVAAYTGRRYRRLTPAQAYRWEIVFGVATIVHSINLALSTLYNFHHQNRVGMVWCTVATFVYLTGMGTRTTFRPWIPQAAGFAMLLPLSFAYLMDADAPMRATALLALTFALYYCESSRMKFTMAVNQLRDRHKLRELAEQDMLTGLANRRHFQESLSAASLWSEPFAVLYIDLDRFKAVNDTFGHAVGDELLRQVSGRLRGAVRETDMLARLGGDEFAILQPCAAEATACALAERINRDIADPFEIDGHSVSIGASVGVKLSAKGATEHAALSLLEKADQALYLVKQAGGGGFVLSPKT